MAFAKFMATPTGRIARVILGVVIIWFGYAVVGKPGGYFLELIGLAPIIAGIMNICLIAPLIGAPLKGNDAK